jgi:hypothetical protein
LRSLGKRPIWIRGLLLSAWLFGAAVQADAPLIHNWSGFSLGPPEETHEAVTVDEFWLEPRLPHVSIPRPAFGDVIAVKLHLEYGTDRPVAELPIDAPTPLERVTMVDPITAQTNNLHLVTFGYSPAKPPRPTANEEPANTVQQDAFALAQREAQRRAMIATWSTPLLTRSAAPPPRTSQAPPRRTVYDILTWPAQRISEMFTGPDESTHIYPASQRR